MFLPDWMPRPIKRFQYWVGNRFIIDRYGTRPFNAIRAEYGLGPIANMFGEYMNSPDRVLGFWPEWFAPPQPDWPPNVGLTGFPLYDEGDVAPLGDDLLRFLDAGDPPIAFTPGSANWQGRHFLTESAEACHLLGRRGILLTRHREHVPAPLPPGVIHVDFAPFSRLLPRCAAVVHHGGIGFRRPGPRRRRPPASHAHGPRPVGQRHAARAARRRSVAGAKEVQKRRAVAAELGLALGSSEVGKRWRRPRRGCGGRTHWARRVGS